MMHESETDINEYHVLTVEKTTPPDGSPDDNWYRYVIGKTAQELNAKNSVLFTTSPGMPKRLLKILIHVSQDMARCMSMAGNADPYH